MLRKFTRYHSRESVPAELVSFPVDASDLDGLLRIAPLQAL